MDVEQVSCRKRALMLVGVSLAMFMLVFLLINLQVGRGGRIPIDFIVEVSNSSISYK
jgi:hypothetical protein